MKFYFTFGYGHQDANGYNLADHYTIIDALDYGHARQKMVAVWGTIWAFQYTEEDFKKSECFNNVTYVPAPKSKKESDPEDWRSEYPDWDNLLDLKCPVCESPLLGSVEQGWYCPDLLVCAFSITDKKLKEIQAVAEMEMPEPDRD